MFSNKASVDNNVIIVTHVEVVHQGPTDECLMILAHLFLLNGKDLKFVSPVVCRAI